MKHTEYHTIGDKLSDISQVEEFVKGLHSVGDEITVTADSVTETYSIKYLNPDRRAISWIKQSNNWEGYTSTNVIRDIKHLIRDAESYNITLTFQGKEKKSDD